MEITLDGIFLSFDLMEKIQEKQFINTQWHTSSYKHRQYGQA